MKATSAIPTTVRLGTHRRLRSDDTGSEVAFSFLPEDPGKVWLETFKRCLGMGELAMISNDLGAPVLRVRYTDASDFQQNMAEILAALGDANNALAERKDAQATVHAKRTEIDAEVDSWISKNIR